MSYSPKTYKKCNFVNLSNDPLKPPKKQKQGKTKPTYKARILKDWRDGWFKGQYELKHRH